ncbi:MAG TPA: hypothetical protein VGD41_05675, partial [Pyrinomonadaceae bacterium]
LASDLRWLISEGYLIEFNDGSLDLPRTKPPAPKQEESTKSTEAEAEPSVPVIAEKTEEVVAEAGGMTIEQTVGDLTAPTTVEAHGEPEKGSPAGESPSESAEDAVPSPS